jgi:predicted transcriptional regulator
MWPQAVGGGQMSDSEPSAYDKLEWGSEIFRESDPAQCDAMPADKDIFAFREDFYALRKTKRDHLLAIFRLGGAAKGLAVNAEVEELTGSNVTHGITYPSLGELREQELISKEQIDGRTNEYSLTGKGRLTIRGGFMAFSHTE